VFANEPFSEIIQRVERCSLGAVQLHGQESPELVDELVKTGITVIKAIFVNGTPSLELMDSFAASAYLVECAGGPLPGGNALAWNWSVAAGVSHEKPLILAGGLHPDNILRAIGEALPDAVDLSSGVESSPGRKDLDKVKRLLEAIAQTAIPKIPRSIFR
jgi:phosphoribosylanthranilate isomerase/indole-3-glycerol phosphate synthase/phosphoribosylanthranilate isomerase